MLKFPLLLDELRDKIHAPQEALGRQLFDNRRADVLTAYDGEIRAGVDDKDHRYKVKVKWDDHGWHAACSCGTHESRICEHTWATVLTAHQDGWFEGRGYDHGDAGGSDAYRAPTDSWTITRRAEGKPVRNDAPPRWKQALDRLAESPAAGARTPWPSTRELAYVIDRDETLLGKGIVLETCARDAKKDGDLAKPKPLKIAKDAIAHLPSADDRLIVAMIAGGERAEYGYYYGGDGASRYRVTAPLARAALPLMCRTGRCFLRTKGFGPQEYAPLTFGDETPWSFRVAVRHDPATHEYVVEGRLERGGETRPLTAPALVTAGGLVFWRDTVEPLDDAGAFHWVAYFREHPALRVPEAQATDLAVRLYGGGPSAALQLPDQLKLEELRPPLELHLRIHPADPKRNYDDRLRAELTFDYEGERIDARSPGRAVLQPDRRRVLLRDARREADAHARIYQLGFREGWDYRTRQQLYTLAPSKLAKAVSALVKDGWHVQADGKLYRQPGDFRIEVSSGIDWFELHGNVRFGDQQADLPQLLAALRKGESMVTLGDGTLGMLPDAWLKKVAPIAGMGKPADDHLRFSRAQAGLLDALLAAQPEATCDDLFENTRQMLRTFEGVTPLEAPATFKGQLRPYQNDALGWFNFLRQFSFGGCLADDMGLGKTIQVLAMLLARKQDLTPTAPRKARNAPNSQLAVAPQVQVSSPSSPHPPPPSSPSLIVVPRSLVFNWLEEAKRFAPSLRILDHSHAARTHATHHFAGYDVVLTTYGTLRNDVAYLREVEFDYVILDEAQAIKNAASESAKAARLLKARHRLALSGTPVQNHLGDLWSLFEFLNPGMLGTSSVLSGASALSKGIDPATRAMLAQALRPFILRRTKEQVAKDLPEKLEQTIYCELDPAQRKQYDELREHYRQNLLDLVAAEGMNKAKIQILEALLRLRQAACHPALIDKTRAPDPSAKLDTLLPRLAEIAGEGHKALVFSQFTSFLAIVKKRLDKDKINYEYLDGKTKDRQARVDRFQSDPDCKLFLISLKAGGVGLNLTAADYVFLLDPWWNPAAESQAIDRTHRIGQTRKVFACRLIAKDTVEEKVLQLQQSKRELADAIIGQDNSVISTLGKAELELLLS
jgi:superfamily II DNA or RNA helicase